jgi:bisphosphoglycerate-independent phosphoglycerate mutase (AlkP superfamily)
MFFHFTEPDYVGHREGGESSEAYINAIRRNDEWLGRLREEIPVGDVTMVATDHGFDIGGPHRSPKNIRPWLHDHASKAWLAANIPLRRRGIMIDIAPTIYDLMGVDHRSYFPPMRGTSLLRGENTWNLNEKPLPGYRIQ